MGELSQNSLERVLAPSLLDVVGSVDMQPPLGFEGGQTPWRSAESAQYLLV